MGFVTDWEDDLIDPEKWGEIYDQMPKECKEIVDEKDCGACVGIGLNDKMGWFIAGSGQGPYIAWCEKNKEEEEEENIEDLLSEF